MQEMNVAHGFWRVVRTLSLSSSSGTSATLVDTLILFW
jgi:hypothetical protein